MSMYCFEISRTKVKTRKDHWCFGCLEKIVKGTLCERYVGTTDDDMTTFHTCQECLDFIEKHHDYVYDDGVMHEGSVKNGRMWLAEDTQRASKATESHSEAVAEGKG